MSAPNHAMPRAEGPNELGSFVSELRSRALERLDDELMAGTISSTMNALKQAAEAAPSHLIHRLDDTATHNREGHSPPARGMGCCGRRQGGWHEP